MKCTDFNDRLDELLDGSLSESKWVEIDQHVAGCQRCQEEVATARRLRDMAEALPRSVEPERDLWPAVRSRLTPRFEVSPRRRLTFRLLAVAATLAVGAGITSFVLRSGGEHEIAVAPGRAPALVPASLDESLLGNAEYELVKASDALRSALLARRTDLAPETQAVVDENLKVIDDALHRVRAALQEDPGNRQLTTILVATYQQQIDLLQRAAALPGQG